MTLKKENLVILVLAVFVGGFVVGRLDMKADRATAGKAPTSMPPETVAETPAVPTPAVPTPAVPTPAVPTPAVPTPAVAHTPTPATPTPAAATSGSSDPEKVWKVTLHPDDAAKGPKDAPVTVVLMTAFGCQACIEFKPAVDKVLAEYGDRIRLVFKHKVFDAQSPDALLAAEASLAANAQGKFWEFQDAAFEAGFAIDRASLEQIAQRLGLDMAKFKKALDTHKHKTQVLRDSLLAYEVGAHSFPNVLANGVRIDKTKNYDSLKKLIESQLVRAKQIMAGGVPADGVYEAAIASGQTFPQLGPPSPRVNTSKSPILGKPDAKVEVVVFEDFECPFCAKSAPNLKEFQSRLPNDVKLVFKQFPLTSLHPNAQLAAEASVEAQEQGKFWEYHDLLFANQQALTRPDLERYAGQIGLDLVKFRSALDTGKHRAAVEADVADGQRAGVSGTPTVFINGRRYQGPRGYSPDGMEAVAVVELGL